MFHASGLAAGLDFFQNQVLQAPVALWHSKGLCVPGAPWDTDPGHVGACIWAQNSFIWEGPKWGQWLQQDLRVHKQKCTSSISGLVVEYIVAIDVTRAQFPADACFAPWRVLGH